MSPREASFAQGYMTNVLAVNDLILHPAGREAPEQAEVLTEDTTDQQEVKEIIYSARDTVSEKSSGEIHNPWP